MAAVIGWGWVAGRWGLERQLIEALVDATPELIRIQKKCLQEGRMCSDG
jgi:hypothetical protein